MTKAAISLASLDVAKASETPFEFEYLDHDGEPTGVFFSVLGGQSATVSAETQKLLNARRKKEAAAEIRAKTGGRKTEAVFVPIEEDIEFGQRLIAVRLCGWRGIKEEFSPALALQLIQSNQHIADAVAEASNDVGNFTKASPTA